MVSAQPAERDDPTPMFLASVAGPGSLGLGVPAPPTSLVGRDAEVAAIVALVRDDGARLVTLTGPGGVGKTRLALQAAAALRDDFAGHVAFVPLAPIRDPALVLPTIAWALGVRETGRRTAADSLAVALRERRLLLVLDNLEQVLTAAPRIAELLAACAGLTVLATSRAPLRLTGERDLLVPPLALPDPARPTEIEELAGNVAVRLFAERAQAARAGLRPHRGERWSTSPRSAAGWTGCRWRSSWRRRGSATSRRGSSGNVWIAACRC